MKWQFKILIVFALLIGVGFSVYRSTLIESMCPTDLPNRVIGARLQKDGIVPYFYKWTPAGGIRYYDFTNFDSFKVSRSTASPFFHTLISPLVELSQRQISKIWLVLQFVLLAIMTVLVCALTPATSRKLVVVFLAVLLTYTEAWDNLIVAGQMYLLVPFMGLLFYYLVYNANGKLYVLAVAGAVAIASVLVKPSLLLFYIPFLFLINRYTAKQRVVFLFPIAAVVIYIALSPWQKTLWSEYYKNIREQIKIHQHLEPALQQNAPSPRFENWDGWNETEINKSIGKNLHMIHDENGNFYFIVQHLFKKKLPLWAMSWGGIAVTVAALIVFYLYHRCSPMQLCNIAFLGWSLYMISDFFSPIARHIYYTVQWFFPLLLAAVLYKSRYNLIYALLLLGLVFNLIDTSYIKMEHTMGEYLWVIAFILLAFKYKLENDVGQR